jgi:oligopeptide transport system substrate-binding protein
MSKRDHRNEQEALLEQLDHRLRMSAFSRRKLVGGSLAGAGAIAMAGLPGSKAVMAQDAAGELDEEQIFYNSSLYADPLSFDWNSNLYVNAEVSTFSGLLTFNPDGEAVADWAQEWESNEDASVWTFYLREGNTGWSNGDPVTAHDFVWSYARILDPETANVYAFILFDVKNGEAFNTGAEVDIDGETRVPTAEDLGLRAIDDWTFEITLEGPRANLPQKVAYLACYPAHRPSVEEHGEEWALGDVPLVSNGPFKLDLWEKGVKIELSKNENHWMADEITLEKVITPLVPAANHVNNFENATGDQQLDWVNLGASDYIRFQENPELAAMLRQYVYPGTWFLLPSNGIPPFDQIEVRRAVSKAVDRNRLVEVTQGLVQPAHCMIPQGVFGFFEDEEIYGIQAFDREAALAELEGTEFEGGQNWPDITMIMRANEELFNSDIMANDIVAQLEENLGMQIQIETLVENTFRPRLYENRDQLVWIRWWYDYPDPDNGYYDMFYGGIPQGSKRQAWENDEFDQIVVEAKGVLDPDERLELYKEAERIIQTDVGYVPLVYRLDVYAFKPWVQNIPVNTQGFTVPDSNIYVRALTQYQISGREEQ